MAREYFKCFHSYKDKCKKLSDQELGRLFRALMEYSESGTAPDLTGRESIAFDFIADEIDRDKSAYAETCRKNAENGANGGKRSVAVGSERKQEEPKPSESDKVEGIRNKELKEIPTNVGTKKSSAFVAPTVEEVEARCREMGYKRTSPVAFVSHYESVGWKVGKNPMKDWKAALAGWEAREQQFRSVARDEPKRKKNAALNYEQTPISKTDFDKLIVDLS